MHRFFSTILLTFSLFSANAQLPTFEWAMQCGNPPNTTDAKTTLAINPQGGFYLAGEFIDQAQFGQKVITSAGGTDIFLVRHDAGGTVLWAGRIGGTDYDFVQNIALDSEGNILVTGYFYGTTQVGDDTYTALGSQDIFVAKFNSDGDFLWSFHAGGIMADYISGISADAEDNLVMSGYYYGEMVFGDTTLLASSSSDIFLAKIDADGSLHWVHSIGGTSSDQSRPVSVGPEGDIFLAGSFYYDITIEDTTLATTDPVGVFIARFAPEGALDWVFQLEGTYLTTEVYIAADHSDNIFVSGNFSEEIFFGNKTFDAGEFNQDIYLAKYQSDGKLSWARHAHSFSSDQVIGLAVDVYDNVYVTGHYLDTMHFNLLTLPYTLCCGSREIFIVNYSAGGDVLWGEKISGTRANIHTIGIDDQGDMVLSGWFTEELLFGPLSLNQNEGYRNFITGMHTDMFTIIPAENPSVSFGFHPNPATNYIIIHLPEAKHDVKLEVYDLTGVRVLSQQVRHGEILNIQSLKSGIYLVQVHDPHNGMKVSSRLIKR